MLASTAAFDPYRPSKKALISRKSVVTTLVQRTVGHYQPFHYPRLSLGPAFKGSIASSGTNPCVPHEPSREKLKVLRINRNGSGGPIQTNLAETDKDAFTRVSLSQYSKLASNVRPLSLFVDIWEECLK